jgi:hypothetical protein
MAGGLVGGRTIEVPVGKLAQVGDLLRDRLNGDNGFQKRQRGHQVTYPAFTTKFAVATNPNV